MNNMATIRVKKVSTGQEWNEDIMIGIHETAEETANRLIRIFNATLKPKESARELVCVLHEWEEEEEPEEVYVNDDEYDEEVIEYDENDQDYSDWGSKDED